MALGIRGGKGSHLEGTQCLWASPGYGDLLQIPEDSDLGGGRQFAGGGQKYGECTGGEE